MPAKMTIDQFTRMTVGFGPGMVVNHMTLKSPHGDEIDLLDFGITGYSSKYDAQGIPVINLTMHGTLSVLVQPDDSA